MIITNTLVIIVNIRSYSKNKLVITLASDTVGTYGKRQ